MTDTLNIMVMCRCGAVFYTGRETKAEDGYFCLACGLPVSSPLRTIKL